MSEVYRNGRMLGGEPLAFSVEHGRFIEIAHDIDVPHAHDLGGATILPGFIDSHCHIMPTGFDLTRLFLGELTTKEQVLDAVRDRVRECGVGEWLVAVHYDQTAFADNAHLHRSQLDAVSSDVPILLRHTNGHASVVNTAALVAAGISKETQDPQGGAYVRDEAGDLTGVLLERAHEHVSTFIPAPTLEQKIEAALLGAEAMARYGITCASDMMTGYSDLEEELEGYRIASEQGARVRFRLYLQWSPLFGKRALAEGRRRELTQAMDPEVCRVAGAKIFSDGAIGAGTAAITGTYTTGGNGKLIYEPDRLNEMVRIAHDVGWPVSVHSIGDRATDFVLTAFEQTGEPSRHRLEHATILRDEQVPRLKEAGCHVTMQPEFVYWLGGSYVKQLGPQATREIKRARTCLDAGIRLSFSSDRPVCAGNPWTGIRTAVTRPDGFGHEENITLEEAVSLYTKGGADANGDVGQMGDIKEGQLADFQVYRTGIDLGANPEPDEVYKGGELTYKKGS